jgi:hypothetical protein
MEQAFPYQVVGGITERRLLITDVTISQHSTRICFSD